MGRISRLKEDADKTAKEIRERKTYVEVEVDAVRNLEDATIDTVRCDTSEVIRTRPMTPEERQLSILDHPKRAARGKKRGEKAEASPAAGEALCA